MAKLKFEIDQEAFDALEEANQGLYAKHGEGYRLDVEGIDTGEDLKKALEHERTNRAKAREDLESLRKEQEAAERTRLEEQKEFESLYKKTQEELDSERKQAREFRDQITQRDIQASAQSIAQELASKDAKRAKVLADYASRFAKLEDGQIVYEIGGLKVDKAQVAKHLKEEFPFLVDGSQASGGGASGGKGGGATSKPLKDMNEKERIEFKQNDPDGFKQALNRK